MIPDVVIYGFSFGITGLLVYVLLRYGSVNHSWVKVNEAQAGQLRDLFDRYRAGRPPPRPSARPMYRRRIVSHEGLAVYPNGLYAKFCIGRKGKYRFVPFEELSGIYPVRMDNPFTRADTRLLGVASWKGLQFETHSGMALLVTALRHDFEVLVPILKNVMGPRWDALYRSDETLWSNLSEGDVLVHHSLRTSRPPAVLAQSPVTPFPPMEGASSYTDKGKLLLEEGPEDLRRRSVTMRRGALVVFAVWVAFSLVALALWAFVPFAAMGFRFLPYFPLFLLLVSPPLLVLGIALLIGSRHPRPVQIFEHGVEVPRLVGAGAFFTSFGETVRIEERSNFLDGELYILRTATPARMVAIPKRMAGLEALWPSIIGKIGRPEHFVRPPLTESDRASSRRAEYAMYLAATALGATVSTVFAAAVFGVLDGPLFLTGLGLVLPPMTTLTLTYAAFRIRHNRRIVPERPDVRVPATIVVVLLAYFLVSVAVGSVPPAEGVPENIEPMPASSALSAGTYANVTLYLVDDLLVRPGETTRIKDSVLQFNLSATRESGIWVAEGGTLILDNVTLRSSPSDRGYTFEVMGSAQITRCDISGVWGNPQMENGDGGLEIYSDDVVIDRTRVSDATTNGILVVNSSPTISNSTIVRAGDDAIEVRASAGRIVNNVITYSGWAIVVAVESTVLVEGNQISYNNHGIAVASSDPVIRGNRFDGNLAYAVKYDEYSSPTLSDNVLVGVGDIVVAEPRSIALELCGTLTIGIAVFSLLALFWIHKEAIRRERISPGLAGSRPR